MKSLDPNKIIFLGHNENNNDNKIIGVSLAKLTQIVSDDNLVIGTTGPQGPTGPLGAQGSQGIPGPTGNQGAQGAQGSVGSIAGTQGFLGFQGETILISGPIGNQGPQGDDGAQGAQGTPVTGPPGASVVGAPGNGSGIITYSPLSDTPAGPLGNDRESIIVNGTLNGLIHNGKSTRIASDASVTLSGSYTVAMASTFGGVYGDYSTLIGNITPGTRIGVNSSFCVIAMSDNCETTGNDKFGVIIASNQCDLIGDTSYCSILGSGNFSDIQGTQYGMMLNVDACNLRDNSDGSVGKFNSIFQSQNCDINGNQRCSIFSSTDSNVFSRIGSQTYNHFITSSYNCEVSDNVGNANCMISSKNSDVTGNYITVIASLNGDATFLSSTKNYNNSIISSENVDFLNLTCKNSSIISSDTCYNRGSYQGVIIACASQCDLGTGTPINCIIAGSSGSDIVNNANNSSIFCSSSFNDIGECKNASITASNNSGISGTSTENAHVMTSDSSDINPSNNISKNSSIISSQDCDINGSTPQQCSIISSDFCQISGTSPTNSIVISSRSSNINGANQAAIISCANCTNSGDNSALIALSGKSYSYTYTVSTGTLEYTIKTNLSDIRFKKDVMKQEMDHQILEKISKTPVSSFRLNEETSEHRLRDGFIAQDLLEYFPQIVAQEHVENIDIYRQKPTDNIWYHHKDNTEVDQEIIESNYFKSTKDPLKAKYKRKIPNKRYSINRSSLTTVLWTAMQKLILEHKKSELKLNSLIAEYKTLVR